MFKKYENISNRAVFGVLIMLSIFGLIISLIAHFLGDNTDLIGWIDSAFQNFSTEVIGAVITFGLIEVLVRSRDEKDKLLQDVRTGSTSIATAALKQLREKGFDDFSTVNFYRANLSGATFSEAIMNECNLHEANLDGANLYEVDLQNSNLRETNLNGANLHEANLQHVDLTFANLTNATLSHTNLQDANLSNTTLQNADLNSANLHNATLPNGIVWSSGVNLDVFTDTTNPNFWRGHEVLAQATDDANTTAIDFTDANLQGVHLDGVTLDNAKFTGANLQSAYLNGASLRQTRLDKTNLQGADLSNSILDGAFLSAAQLNGANLRNAQVSTAKWQHEAFGEVYTAIMPDGTEWSAETTIERFTNPNHPEYRATLNTINNIRRDLGLFLLE